MFVAYLDSHNVHALQSGHLGCRDLGAGKGEINEFDVIAANALGLSRADESWTIGGQEGISSISKAPPPKFHGTRDMLRPR